MTSSPSRLLRVLGAALVLAFSITLSAVAGLAPTAVASTPAEQQTACSDAGGQYTDGLSMWRCSWDTRREPVSQQAKDALTPVCQTSLYVWASGDGKTWTTRAECTYESLQTARYLCSSAVTPAASSFAYSLDSWMCAVSGYAPYMADPLSEQCEARGGTLAVYELHFSCSRPKV